MPVVNKKKRNIGEGRAALPVCIYTYIGENIVLSSKKKSLDKGKKKKDCLDARIKKVNRKALQNNVQIM